MIKIAVIGIVGESVFMTLDEFNKVGETAKATSIHRELGGKGYNQAIAAARYGASVDFLTATGTGESDSVIKEAEADGLTVVACEKDVPSAYAVIETDREGDNRVTVFQGAELEASDVEGFSEYISSANLLLINNEVPEAVNVRAVEIAKENGVFVLYNPAPVRDICDYLLENTDLFTPNEHEASAIGDRSNVIVTLGKAGCLIKESGITVPANRVKAVDTTGAGDTFNGVLACLIAEGKQLEEAARVANIASAIEVSRRFVIPAIPTRKEIEGFFEQ